MPGLTAAQATVLGSLFGVAPDSAVNNLEIALSEEANGAGPMAAVYQLISKEARARRARRAVFEPLIAFCGPVRPLCANFPSRTLAAVWAALGRTDGAEVHAAVVARARKTPSDDDLVLATKTYDGLCARAAQALRNREPAFADVAAMLEDHRPGGTEAFAQYLDLTPVVRGAMAKLPEWVGRMTSDRAAAVRVAYKDAVNFADDAGPRFVEMLFANLAEPWLIVRILSAVMDHPAEGYVAVSELAAFAIFILDDIDGRLRAFKAFDPTGGRAAGIAAGEILRIVGQEIIEFEASIELSREAPWGKRITEQKQALARVAEERLGQIDKALDGAMPLQMIKFGKGLKGLPKLVADPDPAAQRRAEGLMAFFDHTRQFAGQSGYGAARAKTAEKLEARLDQYVEDLLELLRGEQTEALARARLYLEVCAQMMAAARGEKAGQIVRRRAAVAA